jgi:hypothetical protein
MARDLSHDEVVALLGAYALDAVDGDEAAAVLSHLEACPSCRSELEEFRAVAATMARAGPDDAADGVPGPPEGQWARIAARLDPEGRRDRAVVAPLRPAPDSDLGRRHRPRWVAIVVGVAAAVVIALLAVQVNHLDHQVSQLQAARPTGTVQQALDAALADPQAQRIVLTGAERPRAEIVVVPSGTSYFVNRSLPALAPGRTYQLWVFVGTTPISLGLLGGHPGTVAFAFGHTAPVRAVAVTAEPGGGSVGPTTAPAASAPVST